MTSTFAADLPQPAILYLPSQGIPIRVIETPTIPPQGIPIRVIETPADYVTVDAAC